MWAFLRRRTLTQWILFGMVAGGVLGWAAPDVGARVQPLAMLFLRAIKSIIVPLVFSTLVAGIAGHGDDLRKVGRLALRSVIYFEIVTTLALAVGLAMVNLARPGVGVALGAAGAGGPVAGAPTTLSGVLEHIVPQSFFEAAAQNEVLQVVFWSILFGLALTQVQGRPRELIAGFCGGLAEVMFKLTGLVMTYAPVGVGAAIAFTVSRGGLQVLASLGAVILTLYAALVVFALAVLLPVIVLARVPLRAFVRAIKEPALIAFSTASSEAALPLAMEKIHALPRRRLAVHRPGGRRAPVAGTAADDDADAHADQQRGGGGAAGGHRDPGGVGRVVRSPAPGRRGAVRRGSADGHGSHDREPGRERTRGVRDGPVGRRVRAPALSSRLTGRRRGGNSSAFGLGATGEPKGTPVSARGCAAGCRRSRSSRRSASTIRSAAR
jgi:Na+/H+-dicarboxylate symporter